MAGEVRATLIFKDVTAVRHVGWTETFWLRSTGGDLLAALVDAKGMALFRAALLGPGYMIETVRVSKEGIFRDSRIEQTNYTGKLLPMAPENEVGDFASSAVLIRMEADDKNRRQMWLSGAPDSLQSIDKNIADPAWMQKFNRWSGEITANWAYFGLTKNPATNKAPAKEVNPDPPPAFLARPHQLYNITKCIIREYSTRKRGRPFYLYRGRAKAT